jgi:DNA polymerase eta
MTFLEKLQSKVKQAFISLGDALPCVGISLVATGLEQDESSKSRSISTFFSKGSIQPTQNPTPSLSSTNSATASDKDISTPIENDLPQKRKNNLFSYCNTLSPEEYQKQQDQQRQKQTDLQKQEQHTEQGQQGDVWTCDKCHKPIPVLEIDEHTDFHFAMDLQNQEHSQNVQNVRPSTSSNTSSGSKKKNTSRSKNTHPPDKKQKTLFFKPRT